jgi:hypothetical protein
MSDMQTQINITIAVNVTKALSKKTLDTSLYMMDDSLLRSFGQGTGHLTTCCLPGQTIHWTVYAIDLQTIVSIRNIFFLPTCGEPKNYPPDVDLDAYEWIGILPYMEQGRRYAYCLELQMGQGRYGRLAIDTPSLIWPSFASIEQYAHVTNKNKQLWTKK